MSIAIPTEAELNSYKIIATVASNNPYWTKLGGNGSQEQVVATILSIMLLARELGVSPIQAISGGINNINGKFEISARIMNQLIRKHGHKLQLKMSTDKICQIYTQRKDTLEEHTEVYTIEEAILANLTNKGGAWKTVPKDMLFARCISRLARRLYPDCIGGCYVEGELQETIQGKVITTIELPPVEELDFPSPLPPLEEFSSLLPADVDPLLVDQYIDELALKNECTFLQVKKRAHANIDGFLEMFKRWVASKAVLPDPELI